MGRPVASEAGISGGSVVTCSASSIPGINNFGDELLTEIYHSWIQECDPSIEVSHLKVNALAPLSSQTRERVARASFLLFTGGGYFADGYSSVFAVKGHVRALRNRGVYWRVFREARKAGTPCGVAGLEVGPISNTPYRRAVREILTSATHTVVRNKESLANAIELCGPQLNARLYLDAAFTITRRPEPVPSPIHDDRGHFNVCVHFHTLEGNGGWAELVSTIKSSIAPGREPKLFFMYDQRKHGIHPPPWAEIEKRFLDAFPGTPVIPYRTPRETVAAISRMDLVITSKLHVGIVARALDIPVLSVGNHAKIRRCFRSIGEEDVCGTPREFLRDGIPPRLRNCLITPSGAGLPLVDTARQSALSNRDVVREMIALLSSKR